MRRAPDGGYHELESEGAATDDTWEYAIETMLSYANESV